MAWLSSRRTLLVLALVGFAAAASLGGLLATSSTTATSRAPSSGQAGASATISVVGRGLVTGAPDTLEIALAVSTTAPSATRALDENDTEMMALQATLKRAGVPVDGLQTSDLNLSPSYGSNGAITGYAAEDDLSVTLHKLASAGTVIDAASHAVGNDAQIQGLTFSISNTSSLMRSARTAAMHDAHARAENLAAAAGLKLGPVRSITDQETVVSPEPIPYAAFAGPARKAAVPLQAGTQQLSVQVAVVYQLAG